MTEAGRPRAEGGRAAAIAAHDALDEWDPEIIAGQRLAAKADDGASAPISRDAQPKRPGGAAGLFRRGAPSS